MKILYLTGLISLLSLFLVACSSNNLTGKVFEIPSTSHPFVCGTGVYDYDNSGTTDRTDVDFILDIVRGIKNCPSEKDCDIDDDNKITGLDASLYLQQIEINKC